MLNTKANAVIGNSWIELISSKWTNGVVITPITILLGCVLLIISAKIKVPLYPVPMTMQPLAVLMIGMLFGKNLASTTVGLYIFQGLMGLPVFAYGGGFMYIFGPTGGFIIGFLIASTIAAIIAIKVDHPENLEPEDYLIDYLEQNESLDVIAFEDALDSFSENNSSIKNANNFLNDA